MTCSWKSTFGIDCLMCGFQRSFWALAHGDLLESVRLFPALIPLLILAGYAILHLAFQFRRGGKIIVWLFAFSAVLMVGNYGWKL